MRARAMAMILGAALLAVQMPQAVALLPESKMTSSLLISSCGPTAFAGCFAPALKAGSRTTAPMAMCPSNLGSIRPLVMAGGRKGAALVRTPFQRNTFGTGGALRMADPLQNSEDEDDFDQEEVIVTDPDTGKTIECYVDQDVTIGGKPYYIVYPCDTPVVIAYVDKEGAEEELIPVSEDDIPRVFAGAYKACADLDAELVDSAVVLTLQGYEDLENEEEEDLGDAGDDEEFVRVITSYEENGVEYLITEPLEPVLIITKPDDKNKGGGGGRQNLICLPESELTTVMPEVEKLLELRFQDEED